MKSKAFYAGILFSVISVFSSYAQQDDFPVLKGSYLDQKPPGTTPQLFAYDIIDKGSKVFSITFSLDGKEFYYTKSPNPNTNVLMKLKELNGKWTPPAIASFASQYSEYEPLFSPDGQKLIYDSTKPLPGTNTEVSHLWYVEKIDSDWSDPVPMNAPFIKRFAMYATLASNNNIYFTSADDDGPGIFVSRFVNEEYQEPEKLGRNINYLPGCAHPFISPDESYIIYDAELEGKGRYLYISFRDTDGEWLKSVSLGNSINSNIGELTPFVTRDGKYLFFSRMSPGQGDIYWVDAKIIEDLKPESKTWEINYE